MPQDPVTTYIDSMEYEDALSDLLGTLYSWKEKGMNVSTWIEHAEAKIKKIRES